MYQDRNEVLKDSCVAEIAIQFLLGYQLALNDQDGILDVDANTITNAFAANIHRYPGFASIGADWRNWTKEGLSEIHEDVRTFRTVIGARIAELRVVDPDPMYDVKWCGM